MGIFSSSTTVSHPIDRVLRWHARSGALTRLTPHWAGQVVSEAKSLEPGNTAELKASIPGSRGLATTSWVSEQATSSEDSFTDRMTRGPLKYWEHTHDFLRTPNGTVIRDTVDFQALPTAEKISDAPIKSFIEKMFTERNRRLQADLDFQARYEHEPVTVVIAGASGMVGQQVSALLTGGGHTVRTLVRHSPKHEGEFEWDPETGTIDERVFEGSHAVIHLGGATISTRFTEKNKKKILESRVKSTDLLARTLANLANQGGPQIFVCASAIGFYGADRAGEVLNERSTAGNDFLAEVCQQWEAACQPARDAGLRVVNVRTGVVQSALGGSLRMQLPLFLTGTGNAVGQGENMQSWISLDDIAGIYVHAIFSSLEGPVNAVAPSPVTAKHLAKAVGKVLKRPVFVPVPKFAPSLLLKRQGVNELVLADQFVSSRKLENSGYEFFERDLFTALKHELG